VADAPVAILGFDAAESALVRHGIDEGWLPTLARLVETGRWVALSPVPSGFYNTSWASTVTGQDVFAHRAIFDRKLEPGSYRIVDVRAASIGQPPFWRYLSDAGVRSTIASIYSAPVLPSFQGAQAQGWGSIDPYFAKFEEKAFDPPEVEQLLDRAVGNRQALYHLTPPRTSSDFRRYRNRMLRSVEQQTRGLVALVEETEWDLFFASFSEPHQAGHLLWHLADPGHSAHDPDAPEDLKDALFAIYRAVDAGFARVIQRLPHECRVFVLTPHGMAPNYIQDPSELILESGGWLVRRSGVSAGGIRKQLLRQAWSLGRRATPARVRRAVAGRIGGDGLRAAMPLAHIDWQRTRAFALPSDMTSYIRINLQGREPEGIVAAGRDYELVCDELSEAFGSLTHADSGARAVEQVVRVDRALGRPPEDAMPDLCVVWADTERITRLNVNGDAKVSIRSDDPRTGQHRHLGFLIGAGPGIDHDRQETTANLLDVAPTALALLGVDRPPVLSGRPIDAFCDAAAPRQAGHRPR
jgi:predicted AlkP superfamily phosphohydrolase/phosphomutase